MPRTSEGHLKRPSDGREPKTIVFIQCVGSRDEIWARLLLKDVLYVHGQARHSDERAHS